MFRRLGEGSMEYQENREQTKRELSSVELSKPFGGELIELNGELHELQERKDVHQRDFQRANDKMAQESGRTINTLRHLAESNPADRPLVLSFLREGIERFALEEGVDSHTAALEAAQTADNELLELLTPGAMGAEQIILMVDEHQKRFEVRRKELRERLPAIIEEVTAIIEKAVADGWLPIPPERIRERLQRISMEIVDPLVASEKNENGSFRVEGDFVQLREAVANEEEMRSALFHEFTHALAGRSIIADGKTEAPTIVHRRYGFAYSIEQSKDIEQVKLQRFVWLNEAVTEMLALRLENKELSDPRGRYPDEREILQIILQESGIEESVLLQAYFENDDGDKRASVPAWREMSRQIRESLGDGFLVALDKLIAEEGVSAALEALKKQAA